MQLLYVWIEEYHNIRKQGFNFSADYLFDFDYDKKVLSVSLNPNYIPNFFGDSISNITAIVGENGTGKSSILDMKNVCFYLLRHGDSYQINVFNDSYNELKITGLEAHINLKNRKGTATQTLFIKYNPMFEGHRYELDYNPVLEEKINGWKIDTFDISTDAILNGNFFINVHMEDNLILKYNIYELFTQLEFLFTGFKLPYKTPNEVVVLLPLRKKIEIFRQEIDDRIASLEKPFRPYSNTLSKEETERELTMHKNYQKSLQKEIEVFEKIVNNCIENINTIKQHLKKANDTKKLELTKKIAISELMWTAFFEFFNTYPTQGNRNRVGDYDEFALEYPTTPITDWFYDFFERGLKKYIPSVQTGKYDEEVKAWLNLPTMIRAIESLLKNNTISAYCSDSIDRHEILNGDCGITLPLNDSSKYPSIKKPFIEIYRNILWVRMIQSYGFLEFEWRGISSGERMLLSIFARIFSTCEYLKHHSQINSVVLLIDEGEIGFHPEWQRLFITRLTQTLPIIYQNTNIKSIQIILSTHSPFVLSDLPNHHIIFLDKDKEGNCKVVNKNPLQDKRMTFGANIHSLLADGFFMKEGVIGNFAKQKINDLIDDLIGSKPLSSKRKDEIKRVIPLIGEPIIRKKIMDLFNEKLNLNIENKIEDLQRQINELKANKIHDSDTEA